MLSLIFSHPKKAADRTRDTISTQNIITSFNYTDTTHLTTKKELSVVAGAALRRQKQEDLGELETHLVSAVRPYLKNKDLNKEQEGLGI